MRRPLLLSTLTMLVLPLTFACGDDADSKNTGAIDAAPVDAANPDAAVVATACEMYCTNAMTNCTGANALYPEKSKCMTVCAAMPEGAAADQSGDTAYCRAYHAGVPASQMPDLHCPHASASSNTDVCGTLCEAYCDQVMAHCMGANALYADRAACDTACAAANFPEGTFKDQAGDTIQCRIYHASFPAAADPGLHCPHAKVTPDPGTPCAAAAALQ